MPVTMTNRQRQVSVRTPFVKRQARRMMAYLGCSDRELSVVFVHDDGMRVLNRDYRSKDRSTNVLAFSQCRTYPGEPQSKMLGDVVISLPTAAREARELGESLEKRVVFLLAHGLLHLLGYDHEGPDSQRRCMERKEREILSYLAEPTAPVGDRQA